MNFITHPGRGAFSDIVFCFCFVSQTWGGGGSPLLPVEAALIVIFSLRKWL